MPVSVRPWSGRREAGMAAPRGSPEGGDGVLAMTLLAGGSVGVLTWLGLLVSGRFTPENVLFVFAVPGVVLGAAWVVRRSRRQRGRGQRSRPRGRRGSGGSGGAAGRAAPYPRTGGEGAPAGGPLVGEAGGSPP